MLWNVFFGIFPISSQIIVYLGSQDTIDSIDFSAVAIQKHPIDPLKHNFHLPSTLLTGFTVLLSVPTVVSAAVQNGLAVVPKNRINNPIIHSFLATDLLNAYFNRNLVFPILPTRISRTVLFCSNFACHQRTWKTRCKRNLSYIESLYLQTI